MGSPSENLNQEGNPQGMVSTHFEFEYLKYPTVYIHQTQHCEGHALFLSLGVPAFDAVHLELL
jgi:hypothetical protein